MDIRDLYAVYKKFPSVVTDTRKLKPHDIFFALKGTNFNGNQFVKQALQNGAVFAVIDDKDFEIPGKTFLVKDVLQTLQELAGFHRKQFNTLPAGRQVPFLAITGSNGKTTTKELIHAVLSSTYQTCSTEGNLNNHIGVPLTILKIRDDAEIAVLEMGANHIGEIASYCKIAQPTHGIITNCGKAHLEGFGSLEGVKKGKGELFDHLRTCRGTAFVMWDYDYLRTMCHGIHEIISYGSANASIEGSVLKIEPFLEINIKNCYVLASIKTQIIGEYNFPNILAAVTVGKYFKVPEEKIKSAIENYVSANNRSQVIEKGSNKIILDAYNANPGSMVSAIQNFAKIKNDNKVLMLGAMAELGDESLGEHQLIINLLSQYKWKDVVLVGGDFLKINHPYLKFETAEKANAWYRKQDFKHYFILIKGSRSIGMEKVIE